MNNTKQTFTVQDGIETQQAYLAKWKKILNTEAYTKLAARCQYENTKLGTESTGFNVFRGTDLDQYIQNHIMPSIKP